MTRKKTIRNESIRISNRNANGSPPINRSNSRSDFGNSSNNSGKIKFVLAAFVLLEILDAALTFIGISHSGLTFEKNVFIRNLIAGFGFLPVAAIKVFASAAFALLINYFYGKFERYRKYLFYLSVLLMLVAFYGVGSGVYVLNF